MAKLIKCPRCQSLIDVTNLSPGNTVRCPDCGGMARIPTGQTGIQPRVPTPAPQPAAGAGSREGGSRGYGRRGGAGAEGRGRRLPVRRRSNTGVMIGITLGVLAVVALLVVLYTTQQREPPVVKKEAKPPVEEPAAPQPAPEPPPPPPPEPAKPSEADLKAAGEEDAKTANWDNIMSYMKSGGAFDDPDRPEGFYFARIKKMGKAAYPYILKYLDSEELPVARSAATLLNALTGQDKPIPTPATRAQVKADWEAWIKANP